MKIMSAKYVFIGYLSSLLSELVDCVGPENTLLMHERIPNRSEKIISMAHSLNVTRMQVDDINSDQRAFDAFAKAKIVFVGAFSQIFKKNLINSTDAHLINFHPSLLPLYRGANPIEAQILDGVNDIDLSWHRISTKIDAGEILRNAKFPLYENDDYQTVLKKAVNRGAILMRDLVKKPEIKSLSFDLPKETSYFPKFQKSDALITPETSISKAKRIIRALGWLGWVTYLSENLHVHNVTSVLNNGGISIPLKDGHLKIKGILKE